MEPLTKFFSLNLMFHKHGMEVAGENETGRPIRKAMENFMYVAVC